MTAIAPSCKLLLGWVGPWSPAAWPMLASSTNIVKSGFTARFTATISSNNSACHHCMWRYQLSIRRWMRIAKTQAVWVQSQRVPATQYRPRRPTLTCRQWDKRGQRLPYRLLVSARCVDNDDLIPARPGRLWLCRAQGAGCKRCRVQKEQDAGCGVRGARYRVRPNQPFIYSRVKTKFRNDDNPE